MILTAGGMLLSVNAGTEFGLNEDVDPVGIFLSGPLPWWRNQEGFYSDDVVYRVDMKQEDSGKAFTFVSLNRDLFGSQGSVWMAFKKIPSAYDPVGYATFTPPLGFYEGSANLIHTKGTLSLTSIGAGHDRLTVHFFIASFLDPKNASVRRQDKDLYFTQITPCTSQPIHEIARKYDILVEKQTYLEKVTGDASMEVIGGKLEKIIIPKLTLTDSTLENAIAELMQESKLYDTTESHPEKKGVKISVQRFPLAEPTQDAADINLQLNNVTLKEAVRYLAAVRNMTLKIEPNTVVLRPIGWGDCGTLTRKAFYVPQNFFSNNGSVECVTNALVSKWLKSKGLILPVGSTVTYRNSLNILTVRSTLYDLDLLGTLLKEYAKSHLEHDQKK
jgi:hypothetical protein